MLAGAVALLGFAQFVLLGSERFVSTPSAPAYGPDSGDGHSIHDTPDQR